MAYEVSVQLRNPPNGANKWQIRIIDDVGLRTLIWGLDAHDNIGETATFILSPDWLFPLSFDIAIYKAWQENSEWHAQQLYRAQSIWPYLWDFDKNDWGDEEDPDYRYIFIPALGSYYYYVDTEEMILTGAVPPTPRWSVGTTLYFSVEGKDYVFTINSWEYDEYVGDILYTGILYENGSLYSSDYKTHEFVLIGNGAIAQAPTQDWTPIIGMVLVLGMVAMLIPTLKGAFK